MKFGPDGKYGKEKYARRTASADHVTLLASYLSCVRAVCTTPLPYDRHWKSPERYVLVHLYTTMAKISGNGPPTLKLRQLCLLFMNVMIAEHFN